ncbi:MAG: DUF4290 domain-containing protein [Chlorobi bacterium]|nr:DUF4290 domain-containing protein [Chlorobiota bacterium]
MEYNTSLNKLILPEYGRNVQKLVENAVAIKDKEERGRYIEGIINLMGRMYPYLRDLKDFKHKLWDHLVIMSNFKLGDDSPYPPPQTTTFSGTPEKIPYKSKNFKYKHFGKNIVDMLKFAAEMEDGDEKRLLTALIANHMKKLYLTWSKDSVTDEFIFQKIKELTDGKLEVDKDIVLSDSGQLVSASYKKQIQKQQSQQQRQYKRKRK